MNEKKPLPKGKGKKKKKKKGGLNHLSQVIREEKDGSYFCQTNVSIFGNITGNETNGSSRCNIVKEAELV